MKILNLSKTGHPGLASDQGRGTVIWVAVALAKATARPCRAADAFESRRKPKPSAGLQLVEPTGQRGNKSDHRRRIGWHIHRRIFFLRSVVRGRVQCSFEDRHRDRFGE